MHKSFLLKHFSRFNFTIVDINDGAQINEKAGEAAFLQRYPFKGKSILNLNGHQEFYGMMTWANTPGDQFCPLFFIPQNLNIKCKIQGPNYSVYYNMKIHLL